MISTLARWLAALTVAAIFGIQLAGCAHAPTATPGMQVVLRAQPEGEIRFTFNRPLLATGATEASDRSYVVARLNRLLDRIGLRAASFQVVGRDQVLIRVNLPDAAKKAPQVALDDQRRRIMAALRTDHLPDDQPNQRRPFAFVQAPGTSVLHEANQETLAQTAIIIEKRAKALAISDLSVESEAPDRIVIDLRGMASATEARAAIERMALLRRSGTLEFRQLSNRYQIDPTTFSSRQLGFLDQKRHPVPADRVIANSPLILTGQQLKPNCQVGQRRDTNEPVVEFTWTPAGAKIFEDFTRNSIGQHVLIVLGSKVITAPKIMSVIGAEGVIEGYFTAKQAADLAAILNSGSLPLPLEELSVRRIGPK